VRDNGKTHYRKAFNSPYLSSADITEPTILTISRVTLELDKTKKTKDTFNTAYFAEKEIRKGEPLKPMILNATNSKTVKGLAGSAYLEDWMGIAITVYVDANVRFGKETMEGLRISPQAPKRMQYIEPGTKAWDNAKAAYVRDGSLDAVLKRMAMTDENQDVLIAECHSIDTETGEVLA
jgi:hypothetical protein